MERLKFEKKFWQLLSSTLPNMAFYLERLDKEYNLF